MRLYVSTQLVMAPFMLMVQHAHDCTVADIYRIPVSSPAAMARDIKLKAIALDAVLHGVEVKHPLVRLSSLFHSFCCHSTPTRY